MTKAHAVRRWSRIPQLTRVTEVDLGLFAGLDLDAHDHVLGREGFQGADKAPHRGVTANIVMVTCSRWKIAATSTPCARNSVMIARKGVTDEMFCGGRATAGQVSANLRCSSSWLGRAQRPAALGSRPKRGTYRLSCD